MSYKLRISYTGTTLNFEKVFNFLQPYLKRWFAVEEKGKNRDNAHTHWWFISEYSGSCLRSKIREFIQKHLEQDDMTTKGKGNKYYSLGECEEEFPLEYLGYLSKEDQNPVHNLNADLYEQVKTYSETVRKQIAEYKLEKKISVVDKLRSLWESKQIHEPDIDSVIDFVVDFYEQNNKVIMESHMKNHIQTLCIRYVNGYKHEFKYKLYRSLVSPEYRPPSK